VRDVFGYGVSLTRGHVQFRERGGASSPSYTNRVRLFTRLAGGRIDLVTFGSGDRGLLAIRTEKRKEKEREDKRRKKKKEEKKSVVSLIRRRAMIVTFLAGRG